MQPTRVAIIGGGPSGIVAARYLLQHGLDPVIFEQSDGIGGQWNATAAHSGVWPAMRTNTGRLMTCFSDLPHAPGTSLFPTNQQMLAYLQRYASHFGVDRCVRANTRVENIERDSSGSWCIRSTSKSEAPQTELFSHAIIAAGRYNHPSIPVIAGLDTFSGSGGVTHTFHYKAPEQFRGKRVLVAGGAISALEIASDLAMLGASRVVACNRKQRYVIPKLIAGATSDTLAFTRFSALAEEVMPPKMLAQGLKQFILRSSGSPEQFGAPKPDDDINVAGISLSQFYLPLVAEGRIIPKPWICEISGTTVRFTDGSEESVDAILFGTGFNLDLPFASAEIRHSLDLDRGNLDLYNFTFHPNLPRLAFLGLYHQIGPYYPAVELQARWIAYIFSGLLPAHSREQMTAGIAKSQVLRLGLNLPVIFHSTAILFARAAGVEPQLDQWPDLFRTLLFGPLLPISFRLSGPDSLPDAANRLIADVAASGAMPTLDFTPEQQGQLQALANLHPNPALAKMASSAAAKPAHAGG